MNTDGKIRVLSVGKYVKGEFFIKTLAQDGTILEERFEKAFHTKKEDVAIVKPFPSIAKPVVTPVNTNISTTAKSKPFMKEDRLDIPSFMKERHLKMEQERMKRVHGRAWILQSLVSFSKKTVSKVTEKSKTFNHEVELGIPSFMAERNLRRRIEQKLKEQGRLKTLVRDINRKISSL